MESTKPNEPRQAPLEERLQVWILLAEAWRLFMECPVTYILAGLITAGLSTVSLGACAPALVVGYIRMVDRHRQGSAPALEDLFSDFGSTFVPALITGVLGALGVAAGLVLVVLPGVILAFAWSYALFYQALAGTGAVESLGRSFGTVRAHRGPLLLVVLTAVALNILGGLALGIGTVITGPLSIMVMLLSYRELEG